ncbi:hypothetical protein CDAR_494671 [Caerostris darwini]|uniref:Transposase n=1 Tax=Caerostris darwini TaxID=1538125 RepID=A0AAV4UDA0_9ARAC|nr:hypothetical protein CDAR_494671 [Caerostris darwini]
MSTKGVRDMIAIFVETEKIRISTFYCVTATPSTVSREFPRIKELLGELMCIKGLWDMITIFVETDKLGFQPGSAKKSVTPVVLGGITSEVKSNLCL